VAITDQAPFAPTDGVVSVLDKYRETGLGGSKITPELLQRLSIGESIAPRVVTALELLDLIDDEGRPTENFVQFKQASQDAYRDVFAQILYDAYEPVFAVTGRDLTGKAPDEIEDAFRTFRPDSLRKRMVSLFLGLGAYAGIIDEAPGRRRGPKPGGSRAPRPVSTAPRKAVTTPRGGGSGGRVVPPPDVDPVVLAWVKRMPPKGQPWPDADKERWFAALRAIADGIWAPEQGVNSL
jgi:Family of unknown function (DUF5343)